MFREKRQKYDIHWSVCCLKIKELKDNSARLDRDVVAPWEYLRKKAGAAASATQISVRTSSAIGEVLGCADRVLTMPEKWAKEMRLAASVQRAWRRWREWKRERMVAFAMCLHWRLGGESAVGKILDGQMGGEEVVRLCYENYM